MSETELARVKYSRRATQGVVLGIDKAGMWSIGLAALPAGITIDAKSTFDAVPVALLMAPPAVPGVTTDRQRAV